MFFIAAPFGNYLKFKDTIPVTGSWTLKPRSGRVSQILKTLRPIRGGWVNKLGLRNPGIKVGLRKHKTSEVLSLAHIDPDDWVEMYDMIPKDWNVEINISCPNTSPYPPKRFAQEFPLWEGFSKFPKDKRKWCICKIPPTYAKREIEDVIALGYKQIHASNTLRCARGGISGRQLVPYTLKHIDFIKKEFPHVEVIAGGGVYNKEVVNKYLDHGADHISFGTICFKPWKIKELIF